jgi:hypothetical protein
LARGAGVTMTRDEPAFLAFARANVRDCYPSPPALVRELLAYIDRLEGRKK